MFQNLNCELVSTVKKETDGISFELEYIMDVTKEEIGKLKHFRENFAKTSPIHFHFNDNKFSFSQKKYLKKSQFIENPPNMEEVETIFLEEIKTTLVRFDNLLKFENIENSEVTRKINLSTLIW